MPKRVHFETFGCTTNLGDTRSMEGILVQDGHELATSPEEADLVVLNTCTVVDTTQHRIEHRIRSLRAQGKEVVLAGCMAAAQPEELRALAPEAPLIEPRHLHHIDDVVANRPFEPRFRPKSALPRTLGATDAVIQVSEGCLFSCSYCLTKKARGDQSSYPIDDLVADIREVVNRGAIDIRLTSQDTSGFGLDDGRSLAELMERIKDIGGDFKVRVGMMHPSTAYRDLDALLDAFDHDRFYKFLHLPIQTGSERILKAMNRGHTMDAFWACVEGIRERFPDSVVSTDLIVAFPGETDANHQATLDLVDRLQAEHVNITRFSARPHTQAKTLPDRVPTDVAKQRSRELTERVLSHSAARYRRHLDSAMTVHILEEGKIPGTVLARGPGYEPVGIRQPSIEMPLGSRVDVRIAETKATYLIGEPIAAPVPVSKRAA